MSNEPLKNTKKEAGPAFTFFYATSAYGPAAIMAAVAATFISPFMTDTMLLPAAACSVIMFISSLWDAINDPMMGVIADRTNTKWGRYRPWLIPAPVLLTIFSTLMWVNPNLPTMAKAVFFLIMYMGFGMTRTMYTMPHVALLPACVKSDKERNHVIHFGAILNTAAFSIASSFTPQMKAFFENIFHIDNGYVPMMLVFGLMSCVTFWGLFKTSEEKYVVETEEKANAKDIFKVLGEKELWPLLIVWLTFFIGYGLNFGTAVYYLMYYLENPGLITPFFLMLTVTGFIAITFLFPLMLKVFKTGQKVYIFTLITSSVLYILLFLFGKYNVMLMLVLSGLVNLVTTPQIALISILTMDAIDFMQWKTRKSSNGVIASVKGFAEKCGTTVTNTGILAILAVSGYIPNAIGQEPASALFAINATRFGIPVIFAVIQLICLRKNPAEIHRAEIEEMKAKEAAEK